MITKIHLNAGGLSNEFKFPQALNLENNNSNFETCTEFIQPFKERAERLISLTNLCLYLSQYPIEPIERSVSFFIFNPEIKKTSTVGGYCYEIKGNPSMFIYTTKDH